MANQSFGGDWTEQKLEILDNYLTAYCRIFQTNPAARHLETIYVDAFAGGGLIQQPAARKFEKRLFSEFVEKDAIAFLKGSAARALQHAFTRYIFIEKSELRIAELGKLKAQSFAGSRISIRKGDANSKLESFVAATDWKRTRAVVFLDPYGMQVNWNTIARLGETNAVDLWFLFPLGQAVMRLLQKRSEPPPDGNRRWIEFSERTIGIHGFTKQRSRRTSLRRK